MTFVVERLAELERHLEHLRKLRGRVGGAEDLRRDLSLHNDVLFSLLTVCQLVIDIAGELAARRGLNFADYTEAVRNLAAYDEIPEEVIRELARLHLVLAAMTSPGGGGALVGKARQSGAQRGVARVVLELGAYGAI